MLRDQLIVMMVRLLQDTLTEQTVAGEAGEATPSSPLVGGDAVVTSLGLVSFIADVESTLVQSHHLELTLVSEKALSRTNSPFRTIETLADYVLELTGAAVSDRVIA